MLVATIIPTEIERLIRQRNAVAEGEPASLFNPLGKFRYMNIDSVEVLACGDCQDTRLA